MSRRFTLSDAERVLPRVEQAIREAIALKADYEEVEQALGSIAQRVMMLGGVVVDREAVLEQRASRDRLGERLKAAIEGVHELGCLVKDLNTGLVDFPTLYRGREVYLCWKLGERGISFWHGVDEGFAGRKPIDGEFLETHSAQ
ncbi:MAG: DUF2203 domain-containing protein [Bryobacteraceae bacterium]